MNQFLTSHANSSIVLAPLASLNFELFQQNVIYCFKRDPSTLSRLLDLIQDLRLLPQVLHTKVDDFPFAIELASLASRREVFNLEKWLNEQIQQYRAPFIKCCLEFLSDKVVQAPMNADKAVPLSIEIVSIFLRVLHSNIGFHFFSLLFFSLFFFFFFFF